MARFHMLHGALLLATALLATGEGSSKVDGPVIGIDLGTTYSCVGVYKNGLVEIIPNEQGNRIMPSYVAFAGEERLVGEAAKNQATLNPTQTLFDVKRFIGRNFKDSSVQKDMKLLPFKVVADDEGGLSPAFSVTVKGAEKVIRPEEISGMILTKLKESAEKYLGQEVKHAVVSVPAFFNDAQRKATMDAGILADLEILRVISEPTAAALAYGFEKKDQEILLVYDLGGGTCDVSVLKVTSDGTFEVLATAGDPHLGGEDFDQRVMEHLMASFKKKQPELAKKYGKDLFDQRALQRLRSEVEKVKRKLSTVPQAPVKLEALVDEVDLKETLTRAHFEKLNAELFKRTLEPVQQVLKDSGLKKTDINSVVLSGGSARIPKVQQLLSEFFDGKELTRSINPDEAVAHGAAIQAAALSSQGLEQEMLLIDVAPLSLGIQTAGGFMTTVIARNTPLPAESEMVFSTHKDNQEKVTVKIFEGERLMAKNNHPLGSFQIKGISPAPRGTPQIAVTFQVDVNGVLTVSAIDRSSGKGESLTVSDGQARLSKEQIQEMVKEAETFAEEDKKDFAKAEARMALKAFIRSLKAAAELAGEEDSGKLLGAASDAQDWLVANPDAEAEEIQEKREEMAASMPELEELGGASGGSGEGAGHSGGEVDMEGHDEL